MEEKGREGYPVISDNTDESVKSDEDKYCTVSRICGILKFF